MYIIKTENYVYGNYADFYEALDDYIVLHSDNTHLFYDGRPYSELEIARVVELAINRYEIRITRLKDWLANHSE